MRHFRPLALCSFDFLYICFCFAFCLRFLHFFCPRHAQCIRNSSTIHSIVSHCAQCASANSEMESDQKWLSWLRYCVQGSAIQFISLRTQTDKRFLRDRTCISPMLNKHFFFSNSFENGCVECRNGDGRKKKNEKWLLAMDKWQIFTQQGGELFMSNISNIDGVLLGKYTHAHKVIKLIAIFIPFRIHIRWLGAGTSMNSLWLLHPSASTWNVHTSRILVESIASMPSAVRTYDIFWLSVQSKKTAFVWWVKACWPVSVCVRVFVTFV